MADAVTSQTLVDGPSNLVMKFTNLSDGTGEAAVLKVDVSGLSTQPVTGIVCQQVKINKIKAQTTGMAVSVLWDATSDVAAYIIGADTQIEDDFTEFGGIPNNAGAGKTGDVLFTTIGHSLNDSYTIILYMTKLYS